MVRRGGYRALARLDKRCLCPCQTSILLPRTAPRTLATTYRPTTTSLPTLSKTHTSRRTYVIGKNAPPKNIAVLGGGLTGLTTAWYLTRFLPSAKVTIYEGSGRLGGWIDTETVEVEGLEGKKGRVKFERGARMVKPYGINKWDDVAFYELVEGLKLEDEVWTKDEEPGRYIYYPDHMVSLPTEAEFDVRRHGVLGVLGNLGAVLKTILSEPLFDKFIPSTFATTKHSHLEYIWDDKETVGEYVTRMCGGRRELVDNVLSAMMHGIYGGDVWKLGVASNSMLALPFKTRALVDGRKKELQERTRALSEKEDDYWESRRQVEQFIGEAMLKKPIQEFDAKLLDEITNTPVARVMAAWGPKKAIGFKDGFGTLANTLARELEANANVKVVFEPVKGVALDGERINISSESSADGSYDKVISTLYSRTLSTLVPPNTLPSLASTSAVTIRLVNLWSPHPNLNYPHHGFGYLLPQTVPLEQNPHAALGVIFDSDAKPSGADAHTPPYGDTLPGTKLTVMLGGHHWSDLPTAFLPDAYTSDTAAIDAAKDTVQIQLGIPPEAWTVSSTKLCVDCIPQQLPGHIHLMATAHQELLQHFKGKLAVCGGSYTAPGVPGSLRAARDVAAQTAGREKGQRFGVGETGLERFTHGTGREMFVFKEEGWLAGFRGKGRQEGSAGGEGVGVDGDR